MIDTHRFIAILRSLDDPSIAIQIAASDELRAIPEDTRVFNLLSILNDEAQNDALRVCAARLLGNYQRSEVVNSLMKRLLSVDLELRKAVIESLGNLRAREAVIPLAGLLHGDEDADVRWLSADALGRIGDERAVQPLIAALRGHLKSLM